MAYTLKQDASKILIKIWDVGSYSYLYKTILVLFWEKVGMAKKSLTGIRKILN